MHSTVGRYIFNNTNNNSRKGFETHLTSDPEPEQQPETSLPVAQTKLKQYSLWHANQLKMGKIYQVVVSTFWGRKTVIDLGNTEEQFRSMTVLQLKEKIRKKFPDIPGKDNTETPVTHFSDLMSEDEGNTV